MVYMMTPEKARDRTCFALFDLKNEILNVKTVTAGLAAFMGPFWVKILRAEQPAAVFE